MASARLLISFLFLLSGLMIAAEAQPRTPCVLFCVRGAYMRCGRQIIPNRCSCCSYPPGKTCIVHLPSGRTIVCPKY